MKLARWALALGVALAIPAARAEDDLEKIDRTIKKEPKYEHEPKYGLFLFGETKVWVVEDGDTIYVDKNGDGDLTGADEKFEFSGQSATANVGDLDIGGSKHKAFTIQRYGKGLYATLRWNGTSKVMGPWFGDSVALGAKPKDAPVWRPGVDDLKFISRDAVTTLEIGKATEIYLLAGRMGSRQGTFFYVDDEFFKVGGEDHIFVTITGKDANGKKVEVRSEIKGHC